MANKLAPNGSADDKLCLVFQPATNGNALLKSKLFSNVLIYVGHKDDRLLHKNLNN